MSNSPTSPSSSPPDARPAAAASFFAPALTPRQKLARRFGAAVLLTAATGAGGWLMARPSNAAPNDDTVATAAERPLTVRVAPAKRVESYNRRRVYTGTLVAARRSALSFEVRGKIIALAADEGDTVAAGETLARLDTRRIEARLAEAEATLLEARARLSELEFGPRVETIAAARAEVRNLAAQRDVAARNLERRKQLVDTRAVSREEYDQALFDFRAADARVDVAQKALDELLAGTRAEQVDAQRARVDAIAAQVADLRHERDDAALKAPYAGRIAVRRRDEGAVVGAGEPVLEIVEDGALEAWIGLPPRAAKQLEVGAELAISVDGESFSATVQSLRPELDPDTRTRNAVLAISEPAGLVAGQVVRVGLRQQIDHAGYWVPTAALSPRQRGLWAVYVVSDAGVVSARDVEVIEADGDRSFVRGTLASGERIVLAGAHRVVAGQRVAVDTVSGGAATPAFARSEGGEL